MSMAETTNTEKKRTRRVSPTRLSTDVDQETYDTIVKKAAEEDREVPHQVRRILRQWAQHVQAQGNSSPADPVLAAGRAGTPK